jgi:hypothetical protein
MNKHSNTHKFYHQTSLSKSKCSYSNNCFNFLKHSVPLMETRMKIAEKVHLKSYITLVHWEVFVKGKFNIMLFKNHLGLVRRTKKV